MAFTNNFKRLVVSRALRFSLDSCWAYPFAFILLCLCVLPACSIDVQKSPPKSEEFSDCSGVFAFRNTGAEKEGNAVKIYDGEGKVWYAAEFHEEGFDSRGDAGPNRIKPLVLFAGDYVPVFRCVSYSRNWYAVIVEEDEKNPVIKYMLRNDSLFSWQSWNTYFLGKWIRFEKNENPLRAHIDSAEIIEAPDQDTPTRATRINGDRMKLEWTTPSGETHSGWINWRDEETNQVKVWFPYS